jgi:hypothetical protein
MTETQYQTAVAEARTLIKRSEEDQWRLAQLTYENAAPKGRNGKHLLSEWAANVGIDPTYAGRLYNLWESYGQLDLVQRPKFHEAYNEVSPHSGYKPPLNKQEAAEQAAAIQQALSDPEVASKVFSDSATKNRAISAIHHNDQHLPPAPPPPAPTKLDALVLAGEAKDAFRRMFKVVVSLNLAGDEEILSDLGDALDEGEKIHQYLLGMGLDEAIEKIMEGA